MILGYTCWLVGSLGWLLEFVLVLVRMGENGVKHHIAALGYK